jgi:hypothetical protein
MCVAAPCFETRINNVELVRRVVANRRATRRLSLARKQAAFRFLLYPDRGHGRADRARLSLIHFRELLRHALRWLVLYRSVVPAHPVLLRWSDTWTKTG